MISMKELNPHGYPTTPEIDANLAVLYDRINQVRLAYGAPMVVTSGLRSEAQQEALIASGRSTATKSKHLVGAAVDIADADGSLNHWCKENEDFLKQIGLWLETRQGPWQHLQCLPPASGHQWFNP